MEGYIHYYKQGNAFDADYNTDNYYEPWLSYTREYRRVDYNKRNLENETHIWVNGADADINAAATFRDTGMTLTVHSKGGWTLALTGCQSDVTAVTSEEITETVIHLTFPANTGDTVRSMTARFTSETDPDVIRIVTLSQAAVSHVSLTAASEAKLAYDAGSVSVNVATNTECVLSAPAGCSFSVSAVTGDSVVTFTAPSLAAGRTADTTYTLTARTADFSQSDGIAMDTLQVTQEGYPYINASDANVGSAATTGSAAYMSNYGVTVTSHSAGLTNVSAGTANVSFTISDDPDCEDHTYSITLSTTGTSGPAITKTITVTRPAQPATLSVAPRTTGSNAGTVTQTFQSNDTVTVQIVGSPSWLTLNGVTGNTASFTVTQNTGGSDRTATVRYTTAHNGTGGTPVVVDATITQTYVEYEETLESITPTSVTLTYADTTFNANGSASTSTRYCTPSTFKVEYDAVYSNNYDTTTRTEKGVLSGVSNISSIKYTNGTGGGVTSTTSVYANNRGTTTGNSRTILTITGVSFSISGQSFTQPVTSIQFTQEANRVTNTDTTTSTRTVTASTAYQTTYSGVSITLNVTGDTFRANGKTTGGATAGTATATETGAENRYYKVTKYTDTAYTYTFTSHSTSSGTRTDTTGVAQSDKVTSTSYTLNKTADIRHRGQGNWLLFTGGTSSTPYKFRGPDRGTLTGDTRTDTIYVYATRDDSKSATHTVTQYYNLIEQTVQGDRTTTTSSGVTASGLSVSPTTITAVTTSPDRTITVESYVNVTTSSYTYADVWAKYSSGASAKTGTTLVTSGTSTQSMVPAKPTTAWTTSPSYGTISVTSDGSAGENFYYSVQFGGTVSTPPGSTVANGVLKFTNPSATTATGQTRFYYSGTPSTTYYTTLRLGNLVRAMHNGNSCAHFKPSATVTISIEGKGTYTVTATGTSYLDANSVWVNAADINISAAQIPVGSKISGSILFSMNTPSGGSWSKPYMDGYFDDVKSTSQTLTISSGDCGIDEEITWTCS